MKTGHQEGQGKTGRTRNRAPGTIGDRRQVGQGPRGHSAIVRPGLADKNDRDQGARYERTPNIRQDKGQARSISQDKGKSSSNRQDKGQASNIRQDKGQNVKQERVTGHQEG